MLLDKELDLKSVPKNKTEPKDTRKNRKTESQLLEQTEKALGHERAVSPKLGVLSTVAVLSPDTLKFVLERLP